MNEEFKKLHQFLIDEKEALIAALWEEEEQKMQTMKQTLEEMNTQISALSDTIKHIEEQMKAKDATFLNVRGLTNSDNVDKDSFYKKKKK